MSSHMGLTKAQYKALRDIDNLKSFAIRLMKPKVLRAFQHTCTICNFREKKGVSMKSKSHNDLLKDEMELLFIKNTISLLGHHYT